MKKIILLQLILYLLFGISLNAQNQSSRSHSDRLPWVDGKLPVKNVAFYYKVSEGTATTLTDARNKALNSLLIDLGNKAGINVNSQSVSEIKNDLQYSATETSDAMTYSESTNIVTVYKIEREGFRASFSKVSEYYEYSSGLYRLWELYEISANNRDFKAVIPEYTADYGLSAGLRSALIPGWGQFHKGKTVKGVIFLASEVLLATGAVYCDIKRSDNYRKSLETTNLTVVKEYRNRADSWELIRNTVIGTAAGVYVWNVLDAALTRGKIKYAWIPQNMNMVTSEGFYGLAFRF